MESLKKVELPRTHFSFGPSWKLKVVHTTEVEIETVIMRKKLSVINPRSCAGNLLPVFLFELFIIVTGSIFDSYWYPVESYVKCRL
jgi:hypothetical protein